MPYLQVRILNGGFKTKSIFTLDGYDEIVFENDQTIKIDEGTHLLTFDGGFTKWNIQETLETNDYLVVELMLGYNDMCGYTTVVGEPQYYTKSLDEGAVQICEDRIANYKAEEEAKAKRTQRGIILGISIYLFLCVLGLMIAAIIVLFKDIIVSLGLFGLSIFIGSIALLLLLLFFKMRKKHKQSENN